MNLSLDPKPRLRIIWTLFISVLTFLLAYSAVAWHLDQNPDIFTDEIIYTRMSIRVSGEGALVWDRGEPFVVHPPMYFLLQGLYQSMTGDRATPIFAAGDIFSSVYHARTLNAIFAGLTALLLFWMGRRLQNSWLGLLMAALFILDPFGVRINRRAMLETSAVFISLLGVYFLITPSDRRSISLPRAIVAGLFLGFGLLTKELTFPVLFAVLFFSIGEYLRNPRLPRPAMNIASSIPIALLTYGIYPLWIMISGDWNIFFTEKTLGLERLLGLVQLTGWNRPGVSFLDLFLERLTQYGPSYFLLGLGALSTVVLLLWGRDRLAGRFLASWGTVLYPIFAFIMLFGSGNDQFFYFLLIPAIILTGYAITIFAAEVDRRFRYANSPRFRLQIGPIQLTPGNVLAASLLIIILPLNLALWIGTFAFSQDNGYLQLTQFVDTNLPPGALLNASGDPIKFRYFMPDRPISAAATSQEAIQQGVHYFVLTPKDVRLHYGRIQPELAQWIQAKGVRLFATHDNSYGDIFLYRVDDLQIQSVTPTKTTHPSYWRSFEPASSGFIANLNRLLALWCSAILLLAIALQRSHLHQQAPRSKRSTIRPVEIRSDSGD
jgi:4-amino-4-deoxy-L-arabinose transferase-like glycosyltransferase